MKPVSYHFYSADRWSLLSHSYPPIVHMCTGCFWSWIPWALDTPTFEALVSTHPTGVILETLQNQTPPYQVAVRNWWVRWGLWQTGGFRLKGALVSLWDWEPSVARSWDFLRETINLICEILWFLNIGDWHFDIYRAVQRNYVWSGSQFATSCSLDGLSPKGLCTEVAQLLASLFTPRAVNTC